MNPSTIADVWDRVLGVQPSPPPQIVVATAVIALLIVGSRPSWRLARQGITIAHEGGHALVAVLAGRRLEGIRVHSDTSGLTLSRGRPAGLGMVLTLLAGYMAPSLLGLSGAMLLAAGRITLLLWAGLALLFAMLVMIRNAYGMLAVFVTGALIFAVSWYADTAVQAAFAYMAVWFLLIGGVRPVSELHAARRRRRLPESDGDQLARITRIPGLIWVGVFGLANLAALATGGALLLQPLVSTQS